MSDTSVTDPEANGDRWGEFEPDPVDVSEVGDTSQHERRLVASAVRAQTIPAALLDGLRAEHFYNSMLGEAWETLCDMTRRGRPLDVIAVFDELRQRAPQTGRWLQRIVSSRDSVDLDTGTAQSYVLKIRDGHRVRTVQKQILRAQQFLSQGLVDRAQQAMQLGAEVPAEDRYAWTLEEVYAELQVEAAKPPEFVKTPWSKLNADLHGGLTPGQFYVVCAVPGGGKTITGQQFTTEAAKLGDGGLIFSLEMSRVPLIRRLLSTAANVPMSETMRHDFTLSRESWERVNEFRQVVIDAKHNLLINDEQSLTMEQIWSKSRIACSRHDIGVIVIDYAQLVNADDHGRTDTEKIKYVARSCKEMAKDLHKPVVALAQPNRNFAYRDGARLQVTDLHGSSEIEKAADVILLLNKVMDEGDVPTDFVEVDMAKNRYGKLNQYRLLFDGSRQQLVEV